MATPISGTKLTLDTAGLSDRGRQRPCNEDQFLVASLQRSMVVSSTTLPTSEEGLFYLGKPDATLMMVADGMGGKAAGDVASKIAVDSIARYMTSFAPFTGKPKRDTVTGLRTEMRQALVESDLIIRKQIKDEESSMGTTLTLAYVLWPVLYVAHAGDSRCYLQREGELTQLTTDHTIAQKLADKGIEVDEASEMHHRLWNALGGSSDSDPEVYRADLRVDDSILLCSDGLTKHVDDATIAQVIARHPTAIGACRELVDLANRDGGSDNITVVVAHARLETPAERKAKKRRPSLFRGKL